MRPGAKTVATSPIVRRNQRSATKIQIVEVKEVVRTVAASAKGSKKKTGQTAAQQKAPWSAQNLVEPQENAKRASVPASTPKTDGPTAAATIVNSQEVFARITGAPATVGLASGRTAARRIAVGQEGIAGSGSAFARLAGASGLTAVQRTVGPVGSARRASVCAGRAQRASGQTVAQRIARLKAGNVGTAGAPASKVEASGLTAAKKTAGQMESAP